MDGFTRIPNELLEAFYRIKLRDEERRIWLMIARKTYGWNKKEAHIALSHFSVSTGIARSRISRGLQQLIKYNMIASHTRGTSNIKLYSINKDYLTWCVVTPVVLGHKNEWVVTPVGTNGYTRGTSGVPTGGNKVSPPVGPIKEIKEKEKENIKERENLSLSPFLGENGKNEENQADEMADEMDEEIAKLIADCKAKIKKNAANRRGVEQSK